MFRSKNAFQTLGRESGRESQKGQEIPNTKTNYLTLIGE